VYVPFETGHEAHELAPAAPANFPAAQAEQLDWPLAEVYLPATQDVHWVPPVVSLKEPAAQVTQVNAPAAEEVASAQVWQAMAPVTAFEVPAAQVAHEVWPVAPL